MPRTKRTESVTAAVMFEQCPVVSLTNLIVAALRNGDAVMFGQTRSGKAAIVTVYSEDGKERSFADSTEELVHVLAELVESY